MKIIEDRIFEYIDKSSNANSKIEYAVQKFCEQIETPSLNVKVDDAIVLRDQGHFNKAMLNISEANRDQLISIRNIQRILYEVNGTDFKEVVFLKYRQFFPLEIGIENGDEVIMILDEKLAGHDVQILEIKREIHSYELQQKAERERLSFFERRFGNGDEVDEINKMRENLRSIDEKILKLKGIILSKIFKIVNEVLTEKTDVVDKDQKFLELSWNIFFVFLSPIATKYADLVEVEN